MPLPPAERRALAQAHLEAQGRLRGHVVAAAIGFWRGLPAWDRADMGPWLTGTLPLVQAGQRTTAHLADAFVARAVGTQLVSRGVEPVRGGTPLEDVYSRPFYTLWNAYSNGADFAVAHAAAMAQIDRLVSTDVQLTLRATLAQAQRSKRQIIGFQRVVEPNACNLCSEAADTVYADAASFPIHPGCGCGSMPVVAGDGLEPTTPEIVHDGELGALFPASAA